MVTSSSWSNLLLEPELGMCGIEMTFICWPHSETFSPDWNVEPALVKEGGCAIPLGKGILIVEGWLLDGTSNEMEYAGTESGL